MKSVLVSFDKAMMTCMAMMSAVKYSRLVCTKPNASDYVNEMVSNDLWLGINIIILFKFSFLRSNSRIFSDPRKLSEEDYVHFFV